MKILLELDSQTDKEIKLKYDFVDTLVKDLKVRLLNNIDYVDKLKVEKAILNSKILWKYKEKPKSIDSSKVLIDIILSIKWYELENNKFMIQIDKSKKFENSNTSLETVAKIIDYGSPGILPIRYFAKHFNHFKEEAKTYWNRYKEFKTKIKVKRIVTIK